MAKRSPLKVAIVGGGTGHTRAPLRVVGEDPIDGWECWGQNLYHHTRPFQEYAWDRWFEMHPLDMQRERHPAHIHELRRVREGECAIYMHEAYPEIPAAVRYPKEDVEALTAHGAYHCGTLDWMLALAILEGATEVRLHGITLIDSEPIAAKACLEYWIGVAEGRGIQVYTEPWSDVMHALALHATERQYGYDWQYRYHGFSPKVGSLQAYADLMERKLDREAEIEGAYAEVGVSDILAFHSERDYEKYARMFAGDDDG